MYCIYKSVETLRLGGNGNPQDFQVTFLCVSLHDCSVMREGVVEYCFHLSGLTDYDKISHTAQSQNATLG